MQKFDDTNAEVGELLERIEISINLLKREIKEKKSEVQQLKDENKILQERIKNLISGNLIERPEEIKKYLKAIEHCIKILEST